MTNTEYFCQECRQFKSYFGFGPDGKGGVHEVCRLCRPKEDRQRGEHRTCTRCKESRLIKHFGVSYENKRKAVSPVCQFCLRVARKSTKKKYSPPFQDLKPKKEERPASMNINRMV